MRNSPRLPLLLGIAVVLVVILVAMRSFGTAKDASVPVVGLGPVTVMPIGPVPDYAVAAVRKHLQTMGFRSTVQRLSPQPANFDTARRQWIAEALTSQVRTLSLRRPDPASLA